MQVQGWALVKKSILKVLLFNVAVNFHLMTKLSWSKFRADQQIQYISNEDL